MLTIKEFTSKMLTIKELTSKMFTNKVFTSVKRKEIKCMLFKSKLTRFYQKSRVKACPMQIKAHNFKEFIQNKALANKLLTYIMLSYKVLSDKVLTNKLFIKETLS